MHKRVVCTLIVLPLLLCFLGTPTSSRGTSYSSVGVKAGDWAEYSITLTINLPLVNRVHMSVEAVQGTAVTLNITSYRYDGEATSEIYDCDISTGLNIPYGYLIAPNLRTGDPIYLGATVTVNDSTTKTIAGAQRSVSLVKDTRILPLDVPHFDRYYDKAAGILVEQCGDTMMGYMDQTLTATSLWSSGDAAWPILGTGFVVAMVVVLLAYFVRRRPQVERSVNQGQLITYDTT